MRVVCEGWMVKSPPKGQWPGKWKRRWAVLSILSSSSSLGVLRYYTDDNKSVLKGEIDLKDCLHLKQSQKPDT